jgi:hypothetical protein
MDDEGPLVIGRTLAHYRITAAIGAGGPAFARRRIMNELRRGLAVAKETTR